MLMSPHWFAYSHYPHYVGGSLAWETQLKLHLLASWHFRCRMQQPLLRCFLARLWLQREPMPWEGAEWYDGWLYVSTWLGYGAWLWRCVVEVINIYNQLTVNRDYPLSRGGPLRMSWGPKSQAKFPGEWILLKSVAQKSCLKSSQEAPDFSLNAYKINSCLFPAWQSALRVSDLPDPITTGDNA